MNYRSYNHTTKSRRRPAGRALRAGALSVAMLAAGSGAYLAGTSTASAATAAPQAAARTSCGFHFVSQKYTNCRNYADKVKIVYYINSEMGGYSSATYCFRPHHTSGVAVPTSGIAEGSYDLKTRCSQRTTPKPPQNP